MLLLSTPLVRWLKLSSASMRTPHCDLLNLQIVCVWWLSGSALALNAERSSFELCRTHVASAWLNTKKEGLAHVFATAPPNAVLSIGTNTRPDAPNRVTGIHALGAMQTLARSSKLAPAAPLTVRNIQVWRIHWCSQKALTIARAAVRNPIGAMVTGISVSFASLVGHALRCPPMPVH